MMIILQGMSCPSMAQESVTIEKSAKRVMLDGKEYYLHKVLKGQTLYSISKAYDVSLEILMAENPEVKDGLKSGHSLKIPVNNPKPPAESPKEAPPADTVKQTVKLLQKAEAVPCKMELHSEVFTVALMLPLYLSEMDSINPSAPEVKTPASYQSLRFLQFYEGFMMAVDSLEKQGLHLDLHVYDLDEDTLKAKRVLQRPEMKDADLIVSLVYGNIFNIIADYARKKEIPVVNPLSNKRNYLENNPFVFLVNPTVKVMIASIAGFIAEKYGNENIILLSSDKESEKKSMIALTEKLTELLSTSADKPFKLTQIPVASFSLAKLTPLLSNEKDNILVSLAQDELQVANVYRQLKELHSTYSVSVFGMPSWADYKSLEPHDLQMFRFHSFSNNYIDYSDSTVIGFIGDFRDAYATGPEELAFQGFDIAWYFLNGLLYFGKDFTSCLAQMPGDRMSTRYRFESDGICGYENTWLNFIRFQDFKVIDARKP